MTKRRSLTPAGHPATRNDRAAAAAARPSNRSGKRSPLASADDVHATRRATARHGVSMRVTLKSPSGELREGWALNVSRGGVRVVLDDKVELGATFEVTLSTGADPGTSCMGRVVWIQEEPDGVVCGIELAQ